MTESDVPITLDQSKMAQDVADSFGVPAMNIINLLRTQIIKVPEGEDEATDAELALVLSTIRKTGLDPMTGQLHVWRDNKGKLVIMLAYDGWIDYAKKDPQYRYITYEYGPMVPSPDAKGTECWEWMKAIIHDNEGNEIPQAPVYLNEWYVPQKTQYKAPWQKQTKHKLHIVTCRLAIREFCGLTGVVIDEDAPVYHAPGQGQKTDETTDRLAGELNGYKTNVAYVPADAEVVEDSFDKEHALDLHGAERERENRMVDAMAGDAPASDDPELDEPPGTWVHRSEYESGSTTPLLDKLEGIECKVPNCKTVGGNKCGSCGESFCISHMSEDPERCRVCFNGGE